MLTLFKPTLAPARLADVESLTAALDVGLATAPAARDAAR
jgi:hypothetical protein